MIFSNGPPLLQFLMFLLSVPIMLRGLISIDLYKSCTLSRELNCRGFRLKVGLFFFNATHAPCTWMSSTESDVFQCLYHRVFSDRMLIMLALGLMDMTYLLPDNILPWDIYYVEGTIFTLVQIKTYLMPKKEFSSHAFQNSHFTIGELVNVIGNGIRVCQERQQFCCQI